MSNLVSVCEGCHRKLEAIGIAILERGGGRADIRRTELEIITEAKKARLQKYIEKRDQIKEEKDSQQ